MQDAADASISPGPQSKRHKANGDTTAGPTPPSSFAKPASQPVMPLLPAFQYVPSSSKKAKVQANLADLRPETIRNLQLTKEHVFTNESEPASNSVNMLIGAIRNQWPYQREERLQSELFAWTCNEQGVMINEMLKLEKDMIVCLRTGGGKSMSFEIIPYLEPNAYTLLVIPFRALMIDTVRHLEKQHVPYQIADTTGSNPIRPDRNLIVMSAEHAHNSAWIQKIKQASATKMPVVRVIVDEAHEAISGSDYRVSLTRLYSALRFRPLQLILLSATVPPSTVDTLVDAYGLQDDHHMIRSSSCRKELSYQMSPLIAPSDLEEEVKMLFLSALQGFEPGDRCMIFVRSILAGQSLARLLACQFYGGNTDDQQVREEKINGWMNGLFRVIVGTTGLMSGVDYPHVRLVIFALPPFEAMSFIQGCGRAGRDGRPATCVIVRTTSQRREPVPTSDNLGKGFMFSLTHEMFANMLPRKCLRYRITGYIDGEERGICCLDTEELSECGRCMDSTAAERQKYRGKHLFLFLPRQV